MKVKVVVWVLVSAWAGTLNSPIIKHNPSSFFMRASLLIQGMIQGAIQLRRSLTRHLLSQHFEQTLGHTAWHLNDDGLFFGWSGGDCDSHCAISLCYLRQNI